MACPALVPDATTDHMSDVLQAIVTSKDGILGREIADLNAPPDTTPSMEMEASTMHSNISTSVNDA